MSRLTSFSVAASWAVFKSRAMRALSSSGRNSGLMSGLKSNWRLSKRVGGCSGRAGDFLLCFVAGLVLEDVSRDFLRVEGWKKGAEGIQKGLSVAVSPVVAGSARPRTHSETTGATRWMQPAGDPAAGPGRLGTDRGSARYSRPLHDRIQPTPLDPT